MRKVIVIGLTFFLIVSMSSCKKDSTPSPQIPTNGLIAWYPFNGNANDSSGHGLNGTVHGATLTSDRFGKANSAYSFTGNSVQWIDCGTDSLFTALPTMTLSAWVYLYQYSSDNNVGYLVAGTYDGNYHGYFMNTDGPNKANIAFRWGNSEEPKDSTTNLALNTWYNLLVTYNGTLLELYVNGKLVNSSTCTTGVVSNDHFYIGCSGTLWNNPSITMNGKIDDVLLYNRVLSSSEISDVYNTKE